MKTIAMYLPQFHRVIENDEWWGEGFTEWTTVKAADKLFDGHNQVREPLNDNYYNLLQKETMIWQAELAHKYGIDVFCFYHYYFKDGKKILEKPAENLLKWKDIDMPFCFCWANVAWARTWSNLSDVNQWSEKFEKKDNGKAILLEQNYGDEKVWEAHLEYLLPFFEDDRYLKMEGKPVYIFYKPDDIVNLDDMIKYWNKLLQKRGYDGIYAIGVNDIYTINCMDAVLFQAPGAYRTPLVAGVSVKEEWMEGIKVYDYDKLYYNALLVDGVENKRTYFGAFVDWDDTPRRGGLGKCVKNVSPEKFEKYLYEVAIKNLFYGNELLFINAWNEWGEGNYLEPDKKNGYKYLEAVKIVKKRCNLCIKESKIEKEWQQICEKEQITDISNKESNLVYELNKYRNFYRLLNQWLILKEKSRSVEKFFIDNNYKKIIIYGFANIGRHLYEELKNTSIEIIAIADRRQGLSCDDLKFILPTDNIPECDVIIVTAISDFNEIKIGLQEKTEKPIISLQEVIFYL